MINKKKVGDYIPDAVKLIEKSFGQTIPKELNGDITGFGAAIIQSGLIPALAFYERATTSNDKITIRRRKLMRIIGNIIGYDLKSKEEKVDENKEDDILLEKIINEKHLINKNKEKIICASVAVKLSLRIFNQKPGDDIE